MSEWADRHRVIQASYSQDPGPYRSSKTPYLREIMDAFADQSLTRITVVKAARVGGTEAANNMVGYAIDQAPGPILYVFPRETDAKEECATRIAPFIKGSPQIRRHIPHAGWETQEQLDLDSLSIFMAWAKSQATLIRRTVRYVFIDELDNCDQQASFLGDTLTLASWRVKTFGDRAKIVVTSSPTMDHGSAWRGYQASDRRRYYVPCPSCGGYQTMVFERVKVPADQRDADAIETGGLAWYECEHCKVKLRDGQHKSWMTMRGVWVPDAQKIVEALPVDDAKVVEAAKVDRPAADRWLPKIEGGRRVTRMAGFHIGGLLSPWVSWSHLFAEFLRHKDNPDELRVFINSGLGEPWKEAAEEVQADMLWSRREIGHERDVLPDAATTIMVGADVQKDCLYYVIRAWGPMRTSWLLREGIASDFLELHETCLQWFSSPDQQRRLAPKYLAIDSRYRTFEVYDFARGYGGVYPMSGLQSAAYPVMPRPVEYQSNRETAKINRYNVDTGYYKSMLFRLLRAKHGDAGFFGLHRSVTDDYCQQMSAEQYVWKTVRRGHAKVRCLVWEPKTPTAKNHYLDCEVMALALADHLGILRQSLEPAPQPGGAPINPERQQTLPSPQFGKGPMGYPIRRLT